MSTGIHLCGLNGCGKSTLGRALAEALGFHFIDNERLYFTREDGEPYAHPRSRDEVERLLMDEVRAHPDFIFAAVRGDYGTDILPLYTHAVVIEVPKAVRMQRIRNRSYQKFGARMLPGGDLHEQEEAFFHTAAARPDDYVENWLSTLICPILRVDGTKPVEENVARIIDFIHA